MSNFDDLRASLFGNKSPRPAPRQATPTFQRQSSQGGLYLPESVEVPPEPSQNHLGDSASEMALRTLFMQYRKSSGKASPREFMESLEIRVAELAKTGALGKPPAALNESLESEVIFGNKVSDLIGGKS